MSLEETVDTMVSNFNNNLKVTQAMLENPDIFKTEQNGVKLDDRVYQSLQQYYTYLSNSINKLRQITDAENSLLNNNEKSLKDKDNEIDKYGLSLTSVQTNLENKAKMLSSTEYQYELAIKRNEHRRRMVIMLAGLNTMGLIIYYMLSK
jgi:23S rRNA pseudoU1915 N3-methylase RlmH